jgi:hypothetical protein
MAGAEQADAMLARLEQQRAALQSARDREQSLAAFSERVMDTVGSVVIVLDAQGRLRRSNSRAREVLRPWPKATAWTCCSTRRTRCAWRASCRRCRGRCIRCCSNRCADTGTTAPNTAWPCAAAATATI